MPECRFVRCVGRFCFGTRVRGRKAFFALVVIVSFFLVGDFSVYAVEYGGLGGRPAYPREDNPRTQSIFVHTLKPGSSQEEGVVIINNTSQEKILLLYATDSTPSTGGSFACKQFSEQKKSVGSWITLSESEVVLPPGTSQTIPFTITVPYSAGVGEHNGCLLIQEKKEKTEGQSGVNLSVRTGLRVAIAIPGDIIRVLSIEDFIVLFQKERKVFLIRPRVKNDGNVSIDADVKVIVKNVFGVTTQEFGGEYPVLRGEVSEWNFEMGKTFWGGWYRAFTLVTYDAHETAGIGVESGEVLSYVQSPTVWFFSVPHMGAIGVYIVVLVAIGAGVVLVIRMRRRALWIAESWVLYTVKSGEDIQDIAKQVNVSWKLLAQVNGLQPPYTLKSRTKIRIPPQA